MRRQRTQDAARSALSLFLAASLALSSVPTAAIAEAVAPDADDVGIAAVTLSMGAGQDNVLTAEELEAQLDEATAQVELLSADADAGDADVVNADAPSTAADTTSDLTYIDDDSDPWSGYYYTAIGATGEADPDTGRAPGTYVELDDDGNATIAGTCGTVTAYEVPATLDGHPVTAIGGGAFGQSSNGTAVTELRPLASLTFAAGSNLETIGYGAFGTTSITSVAFPNSLKVIEQDAFYSCTKLATVTWPNNPDFAEVNGFQSCDGLGTDAVASLPASVTTIGEKAFAGCFGLTRIELPASIKAVGTSAFESCQNATAITLNEGLASIGPKAFASCYAMEGATVTLPRSVTSLPNDVFKNDHTTSSGSTWTRSHSAITLRILNPDFALTDDSYYDYDDQITIDGASYTNPFDVGQTIVAHKTDSAGNPSVISKLAALLADEKDPYDETGSTPAYTFEWLADTVRLTGSIPAGATVRLSQDGQAVSATVDEAGNVTADVEDGKTVTVRVSLAGYYDLYRSVDIPADATTATFDAVTEADMEPLPVSGAVALDVQAQTLSADGALATSTFAALDPAMVTLSVGGRTLTQGEGKDYAVSGNSLVIYEAAGVSRQDELEVTVDPGSDQGVCAASATFKIDDEKIELTLAAYGLAHITCSGDFAGNDRVYVFRNSFKVDEGVTTAELVDPAGSEATAERYVTTPLAAGSYTAVAVNQTGTTFKVNSLEALTRLGFVTGQNCARADFTVADGKVTDVALDVSTFDAAAYARAAGVETASITLSDRNVSADTEITATVLASLADGVTGKMVLQMPADCMDDLWVGDSITGSNVGADIDADACQVTLDLSGQSSYELRFKAKDAGSHAISGAVVIGANTLPVTSASFDVYDLMLVPDAYTMTTKTGRATVYAKPFSPVELEVEGGQTVSSKTNAYGRAYIDFALPDDVYPGQRVALTAKVGQSTAQAGVTFLGGVSIQDFAVTNGASTTIHPFKDGKATDDWMTIYYHEPKEKNAYWSFDLLLSKPENSRETPETLNLEATSYDGRTYDILLTKQSEDSESARYIGEKVDEKYLELLRAYQEAGEDGYLSIPSWDGLFVPESFSLDSTLLCGVTSFDVAVSADQSAKKAEEERQQAIADATAEFNANCEETNAALRSIWDIIIEEVGADNVGGTFDELIGTTDQLYTEAGDADGNTVEDYFFDDDLSLDSDSGWLDDLVSVDYGDAEANAAAQRLASLVSRYDKLAEQAKTDVCTSLNIPGSLSDYKDVNEVAEKTFEQMKGVEVKDRSEVDTSQYTQAGTSGLYKLDEQPIGNYVGVEGVSVTGADGATGRAAGVARDALTDGDEEIAIETSYSENAWSDAADAGWSNLEAGGLLSIDEFTNLFNNKAGRAFIRLACGGSRERTMKLFRGLRHVKGCKVVVEGMGEAYKFSASKALSGAVGTGIAINGVRKTAESNVSIVARIAEEEGNLEGLQNMLRWQLSKNPPNQDCINAIRNAISIEEDYIKLLKQERFNNNADMVVGCSMAVLGFVASVATVGVGGIFLAGAGLAYDAGSNAAHLQRGVYLDRAASDLAAANERIRRACQDKDGKVPGLPSKDGSMTPQEAWEAYQKGKISQERFWMACGIVIDPSGYVFEAVEDNRLSGVETTIWVADDASGTGARIWNAKDYEQKNPQVTGETGTYAWDTPTGWYQVRFHKDGYEDAQTEWMSVPPIRTDVNVALTTTQGPELTEVRAYTDRLELEFSQYMDVDSCDASALGIDGLDGCTLEWQDVVDDVTGKRVSRLLYVTYPQELAEGDNVLLDIAAGWKNYAGLEMSDWQVLSQAEVRPATLELNSAVAITGLVGQKYEVVAYLRDADGKPLANRTLQASVDSSTVATLSDEFPGGTVVTDENGMARFSLDLLLPGLTSLTVGTHNGGLSVTLPVRVSMEQLRPNRPTGTIDGQSFGASAPKENYATVKKGSKLEISAEPGVTIYYTTDDTCPCAPGGSRREYTGPITVEANAKYRITAFKDGMPYDDYSERLNITVTVTDDGGEPVDPVDPVEPIDPIGPSEPEGPTQPSEPENPSGPQDPANQQPGASEPAGTAKPSGEKGTGSDQAVPAAGDASLAWGGALVAGFVLLAWAALRRRMTR